MTRLGEKERAHKSIIS